LTPFEIGHVRRIKRSDADVIDKAQLRQIA